MLIPMSLSLLVIYRQQGDLISSRDPGGRKRLSAEVYGKSEHFYGPSSLLTPPAPPTPEILSFRR